MVVFLLLGTEKGSPGSQQRGWRVHLLPWGQGGRGEKR